MIPWASPHLDEDEQNEVMDALRTRRVGMGARVRLFEDLMAAIVGRKHAVAVTNGTVALDLALKSLRIGEGDEVILPAMTYVATLSAVLYQRATPVFADIHPSSCTIDPVSVRSLLGPRTKAILLMDYGGNPCDHDEFRAISEESGIPLVLDGAQSIGGAYRAIPLCRFGRISTTSFHVAKPLTSVEGGMVFTDDDSIAQTVRLLRNQGEDPNRKSYHVSLGSDARLSDLHAAVGLAQIRKLDAMVQKRAEIAAHYGRVLDRIARARAVWREEVSPGRRGWFLYPVLVPNRDAVADFLSRNGVENRICYPMPVYRQPFYRDIFPCEEPPVCPNAEDMTSRVLTLPMHVHLEEWHVDRVASVLQAALDAVGDEPLSVDAPRVGSPIER